MLLPVAMTVKPLPRYSRGRIVDPGSSSWNM
jgi:hypothetical protein